VFDIADANGNSGGISEQAYTVVAGQSTACLTSPSTPVVTMKIDEPSSLTTCSLLPIHIDGGQKPYIVTSAAVNASFPTNKTLGSDHDTYELLNQMPPRTQFIIAVSDRSVERHSRSKQNIDSHIK
jgi:hypothetical protein